MNKKMDFKEKGELMGFGETHMCVICLLLVQPTNPLVRARNIKL